ncbi:MAG: hypothetical protein ACRENG_01890, partial [bacterium]
NGLLRVYQRLLFVWKDLRCHVKSIFKPRPAVKGSNLSLGGKSHENAASDGLLLSHHPAMEPNAERSRHIDLAR